MTILSILFGAVFILGFATCLEWFCQRKGKGRARWIVTGVQTRNKRKEEVND